MIYGVNELYKDFADILIAAGGNPGKVVVPCADNREAMEAVNQAIAAGILNGGIFIGDIPGIEKVADISGLDLKKFELHEAPDAMASADLAVELVLQEKGDFLLKGSLDTATYLKAVLKRSKELIPEGTLLSHIAILQIPSYHKFLFLTDVAINIKPSVETKKKIILNALKVCNKLGIKKPKVSLLASIERLNPKIQSTVDAIQVRDELRAEHPDKMIVEGPYDVYISISKHAALIKKVEGAVCGDADILLLPDMDSGNAAYKFINSWVTDCLIAGMVIGSKIPLVLPSRADPVSTKLLSIALAAVFMRT